MTYEDLIDRLRYDRELIRKVSILTEEQIDMLLKIYDRLTRILHGNRILLILLHALLILSGAPPFFVTKHGKVEVVCRK